MTLVLDTGPLVTLTDRKDPLQKTVQDFLEGEPGELVLPAPVMAEVDYLLGVRVGREAQRKFLADLASGRFRVECLTAAEYDLLCQIDEDYADLNAGLADLSVVVIAHRFNTRRIATFDERHFRALRPVGGGSFRILPKDET